MDVKEAMDQRISLRAYDKALSKRNFLSSSH